MTRLQNAAARLVPQEVHHKGVAMPTGVSAAGSTGASIRPQAADLGAAIMWPRG